MYHLTGRVIPRNLKYQNVVIPTLEGFCQQWSNSTLDDRLDFQEAFLELFSVYKSHHNLSIKKIASCFYQGQFIATANQHTQIHILVLRMYLHEKERWYQFFQQTREYSEADLNALIVRLGSQIHRLETMLIMVILLTVHNSLSMMQDIWTTREMLYARLDDCEYTLQALLSAAPCTLQRMIKL